MAREKVYSVDAVTLSRQKTNPPVIRIEATGIARSTGWSEPELVQRQLGTAPADGVYEFDFTAERPAGISLPTLTPIKAARALAEPPDDLRGVRIHAATGHKEAHLNSD